MINSGIPGAEDWPAGCLEALAAWEQGDVVANPHLFYFADPRFPIWEASRRYQADSEGPEIVQAPDSHQPPYGLVTSQTCDIAEADSARPLRPWVQIAPIFVEMDKGWRKKLLKGGGPRYWLHVPDLPGSDVFVADLRIEMPVEKGWLAQQERIEGFPSEEAKSVVGRRTSMLRGRPAFSTDFNKTILDPLLAAIEDDGEEDDRPDDFLDELVEVAVLVDSTLQPTSVQVVFITESDIGPGVEDWLQGWRDGRVEEADSAGISLLALDIRKLAEIPASEYRRMIVVWMKQ